MIIDRFSKEEIIFINNYCKENNLSNEQKKDYIQTLIINRSLKTKSTKIVYCAFTGFGKTYLGSKFVSRFSNKYKDEKIIVVSPTTHLQKEWASISEKIISKVINTFTISNTEKERETGLLIVDEVHHSLGKDSVFFNKALDSKALYKVGLSATLEDAHIKLLKEKNFEYMFILSIEDGIKLNIVPEYRIINLPVHFTKSEQVFYVKNEEEINNIIGLFSFLLEGSYEKKEYLLEYIISSLLKNKKEIVKFQGLEMSVPNWIDYVFNKALEKGIKINDKGSIVGQAKKLQICLNKRNTLIDECYNKLAITNHIIKYLNKDNEDIKKCLVFVKGTDFSSKLKEILKKNNIKASVFHSKITDKLLELTMKAFYADVVPVLISINKLKEGFSVKDVSLAIRLAYNGTRRDAEQITGRILRLDDKNVNKKALLINVYVDDFTYSDGRLFLSREVEKLQYAYKNLDYTWEDSIESAMENVKIELEL